jgi:hypothetical protein
VRWLQEILVNRAAGKYVSRLPPVLMEGWGASTAYTPGQIEAAVKTARLDRRFIALAYAAYLSEEDYARAKPSLPLKLPYGGARSTFQQYASWHIDRPWEAAPMNADAMIGDLANAYSGGGNSQT